MPRIHFGGLNCFGDIGAALAEITRVTRIGGVVVVGDEGVPPWLRKSLFGRILMNTNPLYSAPLPLKYLPEHARDVCVEWIIGGVFYVIKYTVGDGPPFVDLDYPIPGRRGGTHRTRYFGRLEGVTIETKERVLTASQRAGKSLHTWLEEVIRASETSENWVSRAPLSWLVCRACPH